MRSETMLCRGRVWTPGSRPGGTNPVVVVLLAGILVALVVLIGVLVTQKGGTVRDGTIAPPPATPGAAEGQVIKRSELPKSPKSPKPIDDPDRIKETLQAGKTYHVVLKAG